MVNFQFSIIIPVYNRPNEIDELLESLTHQTYAKWFEVVVVEDGSENTSKEIVESYSEKLNIQYFLKQNTGAGKSRNFGMEKAKGNYFVIFDSDCIIPPKYLEEVEKALKENFTDAYGGPDAAHKSFTTIQKAVNYSMTSVFTTGGIRGNKNAVGKFQPRSFNLGISKKAFTKTQGFSGMKIGEDIDLTFRIWDAGFKTQLIEEGFVYHKRRATFKQFFKQTFNFGKARPFLNKKFSGTAKITYWFPSVFMLGLLFSLVVLGFGFPVFIYVFVFYFLLIFVDSLIQNKSISVAVTSIFTTLTQFFGYGLGFLKGMVKT